MSQKRRFKRLAALLPLLVTVLLVHWRLPIAAAAAGIPTVTVGLQASVTAAGPAPAANNATPLLIVAQLNLDQAAQQPSVIVPAALNPSGSFLAPVSDISLPISPTCGLANNSTMLVCQIAPTGATWGTSGFVVFNVLLTAISGHTQVSSPVVIRIQ
jgi:hypothetical protein